MTTHFKHGLRGSTAAMAGAAEDLSIEALIGDSELVTVFDDFNSIVKGIDTFGASAIFEDSGWVLTDEAGAVPVVDAISMNDPSGTVYYEPSCLRIFTGTADDTGGNMQLDLLNGAVGTLISTADFPHLWIPDNGGTSGAAVLDNTTWVFACRIGLRADLTVTGAGAWDSKAFIGWAAAGDTSVMDHDTGALTDAVGNLHGFHIPEDGSIDGVSKRISGDSLVDGTNFTELVAAGGVDGTVANGAVTAGDTMWFDLALRMDITDESDDAANGVTTFYHRRVPNKAVGAVGPWRKHSTQLLNQTPNHSIHLVPTIEVLNGPTAGVDGVFMLDWWAFGTSRQSLR